MRPSPQRTRAAAMALSVAICLTSILAPTGAGAQDQPEITDDAQVGQPAALPALDPPAGPGLTFHQLGLERSVSLGGRAASRVLEIPVPHGMRLADLTATARTSTGAPAGTLEVRAQDLPVTTVDLESNGASTTLLTVPLEDVPVERNLVRIELLTRLGDDQELACAALIADPEVILTDGSVTYAGTATEPLTISEFLPPVLTHLDIVTPEAYSPQQAQSALRLAANVAMQYGDRRPLIEVHAGPVPSNPPSPFRRTIVLTQDQTGVSVQSSPSGSVLLVGGDGDALAQQIDLLTTQLDRLAVVDEANVTSSQPVPQEMVRGRRTFAALGFSNLQARGVGQIDLGVPFSQSSLGGPTTSIVARILGTTTPVPDGASASISTLFNDVVVSSQALDASGAFDMRVSLPDRLVRRDNNLVLRVDYTPPGGLCDPGTQRMTVQIDPSSLISGTEGTSLPPGFDRLPQAFLPTFTVALGTLDLPSLRIATDMVVSLQRLSVRLLRPDVQPWATAVSSNAPTLLVGQENVDFDAALRPPLSLLSVGDVQATTEPMQISMNGEIAAIQAFNVGPRDIVLATWQGDQSLLVQLADEIVADEDGWRGLGGDVAVQGSIGEAQLLALRTPQPGVTIDPPTEEGPLSAPRTIIVAVLATAALLVVLLAWLWSRRRRQDPESTGAEATDDSESRRI